MLRRSGHSGYPYLALDLKRKSFQPFTAEHISWGRGGEAVIYGLYCVEMCSFYVLCWKLLSWKGTEFCQVLFLHLLRYSHLLIFHSVKWVLHLLVYACWALCIPGVSPAWRRCAALHGATGPSLLALCWGPHSSGTLACRFFSCSVLVIRVMLAEKNEYANVPSSSAFGRSLRKAGIYFSLNIW